MFKEIKTEMQDNIGGTIFLIVFIIGILGCVYLGVKSYGAEEFCQDKGHEYGRYKAIGDGYYSCADYTRYDLNGVKKEDGEN